MSAVLKRREFVSYTDSVVLKPWGYEFEIYDNGKCSLWLLHIKPGQGTSIHCHCSKEATFLPLRGVLTARTNDGVHDLVFPFAMKVDRYTFHSVSNRTEEPLVLLELETPSDKSDLMRLRDGYGRVGRGYEGNDAIIREGLDCYGHFRLSDDGETKNYGVHRLTLRKGLLTIGEVTSDRETFLNLNLEG